jgi:hypothetical protein
LFGGSSNAEEESHPTDSLFLKSNKQDKPRSLFSATPKAEEGKDKAAHQHKSKKNKGQYSGSPRDNQTHQIKQPEVDVRLEPREICKLIEIDYSNPILEEKLMADAERLLSLFEAKDWN